MNRPPSEENRPSSAAEEEAERRIENLRAVMQGPSKPSRKEDQRSQGGSPDTSSHRGRKSFLAVLGAGIIFLLGKIKFLGFLATVLKLKTLGTMLLSIGLYAIEWGWAFAAGFVILIFVHECGHAIAMRR